MITPGLRSYTPASSVGDTFPHTEHRSRSSSRTLGHAHRLALPDELSLRLGARAPIDQHSVHGMEKHAHCRGDNILRVCTSCEHHILRRRPGRRWTEQPVQNVRSYLTSLREPIRVSTRTRPDPPRGNKQDTIRCSARNSAPTRRMVCREVSPPVRRRWRCWALVIFGLLSRSRIVTQTFRELAYGACPALVAVGSVPTDSAFFCLLGRGSFSSEKKPVCSPPINPYETLIFSSGVISMPSSSCCPCRRLPGR
jgi:hypothetical protein